MSAPRETAMTKPANRSIPSADVIPVLRVADVRGAARWLVDALGFRERVRIADHRVQLAYGAGALVVAEARQPAAEPAASVMLRVENLDARFARAVERGATTIHAPETYPYGERQATLRAPFGHVFTLSQTIADVDPADWGGELVT
ncbi:MAG TPA: VOC family protein [Rhodanobacteraceae bacterium]|nr:VOC family protein [Rhodanobacteraceae bacterium]